MREMILNKAFSMFVELGFKSVTMDDIAKELGISKKTIYQHFSSKTVLVTEIVEYAYDKAIGEMQRVMELNLNAIEEHFEIRSAISEIFNFEVNPSNMYQFQKYYPELANYINRRRFEDYEKTIIHNLKKGVAEGLYRSEIDLDIAGYFFFILTSQLCNTEVVDLQKKHSLNVIQDSYLEYHLRAIVTPAGLEVLERILKLNLLTI